jgi:hypothetical protein
MAHAPRLEPTGRFRRFWEGWKRFGRKLGDLQARALLTVFYFVVLPPFALVVRWATDPLAVKPRTPRGWRPRTPPAGTALERGRRQF